MNNYLIYAANGDIYHREESNILDDLSDILDHALDLKEFSVGMHRWVRESDLDNGRRPAQSWYGWDAVLDWALEHTDGEDDRFTDLLNRWKAENQ